MDNNDSAFRKIGSTGLVVFERDGTLLRRISPRRDFTLGDISNEFVQMLKQLRDVDVRFGFISDARGMDAGSRGGSEFAALTTRLDELLRIREAMPDFWIASRIFPQGSEAVVQAGDERRTKDGADPISAMIQRAIEWYGVDKKETIFVSSTAAGLLAADDADISAIPHSSLRGDRTTVLESDIFLRLKLSAPNAFALRSNGFWG
jgi:histidinol phosphatase-like enzyme